jgi:hypothetical protein
MAYGTINADVISTSVANTSLGAGNATVFKNRLINGDMRIDQRNAGASVTPTSNAYTLDRWVANLGASSKYSVQQNAGSVTPPTGFINYLGCTSLAATTVSAGDYYYISQIIEGLNIADLGWGAADAKTVTLSFWVRSSLTGTFGGALNNSGASRSYPFAYSIPVANTWTQISITVAGDTTGTWLTTNGKGIEVVFGLGVGSTYSGTANTWAGSNYRSATGATSVVGTSGATFYITGVQLEVGSSATGFEYVDYGTQLAMCQRYYAKTYDINVVPGTASATGGCIANVASLPNTLITFQHPVNLRTSPTLYFYAPLSGTVSSMQSSGATVVAGTNSAYNGMKSSFCYSNNCTSIDNYVHMVVSAEL